MSVRTLTYNIDASGIIPAAEQFAGSQGDIKATELCFTLSEKLWASLPEISRLRFRFDGYDGEGNILRGDSFALEEQCEIRYLLPEAITRYGGRICVYLIITQILDSETEMELYSFPARMRLNLLPSSNGETDGELESLTTLAESAKKAAEKAKEAEETTVDAMERTELAHTALTEGAEFIFDGGTASSSVSIELVVDSELNSASENPVQNKAVKKELSDLVNNDIAINEKIKEINQNTDENANDINNINDRLEKETDYIVEQGESNGWQYRKWNSGIAECWKTINGTVNGADLTEWSAPLYTYNGKMFIGDRENLKYPFIFKTLPNCSYSLHCAPGLNFWLMTQGESDGDGTLDYTQYAPYVQLVRALKYETSCEISVHYQVIGKWK